MLEAIPVHDPIPTVQLANPPLRGQLAELCGSLALAAVLAGLFSMLWARLASLHDWTMIGSGFFLTILVSWAVLVPAKVFNSRRGDAGLRRGFMLVIGLVVGLAALWVAVMVYRLLDLFLRHDDAQRLREVRLSLLHLCPLVGQPLQVLPGRSRFFEPPP